MNNIIANILTQLRKLKCRIANLTKRVTYIEDNCCNGGGGDGVQSIIPGDNISVDNTDPQNPVVSSTGGGEFVEITEGGNTGWGLKYRADNPDYYGNIGRFAVDLSYSRSNFNDYGATGFQSFAAGYQSTASGQRSIAIGFDGIASGDNSVTIGGKVNTSNGYASFTTGDTNTANSLGETVIGLHSTDVPGNALSFIATDRLFNIGNGTSTVARSDAFTILKNGLATLPSVTNTLIDAEPTGKAVVTKEWVEDFYTTITGYDVGATQTLKHVNGVLQWVTE